MLGRQLDAQRRFLTRGELKFPHLADAIVLLDVRHVQVGAVALDILVAAGESRSVELVRLETVLVLRMQDAGCA